MGPSQESRDCRAIGFRFFLLRCSGLPRSPGIFYGLGFRGLGVRGLGLGLWL